MESKIRITRRRFLGSASVVAAAAATQAMSASSGAAITAASATYSPTYFTAAEWAFINAVVGRMIPHGTNGPGGVEAGVPEFIDRQMNMPYGHGSYMYMQGPFITDADPALGYQLKYTPRELYRIGIAAADRACKVNYGKSFVELTPDVQDRFLSGLEKGSIDIDGLPATTFFAQLLANVREGYFSDPLYGGNKGMSAWKHIGFPGARADFTDWLDQPGKAYPYGPVSINGTRGT